MPIAPMGLNVNKVVAKYKNHLMLKGTTADFHPQKESFHLESSTGRLYEVKLDDLKAVFFVKDLEGDKNHRKIYHDDLRGSGRKLKIQFHDGEQVLGYSNGFNPKRTGFFMIPSDPAGNNERIFVINSATTQIDAG